MSFRFINTEKYLTNYAKRLIVSTRQEIGKPRTRTYRSLNFMNRSITSPLNSSGDLKNSLTLVKKLKNVVSESGFKATQSYRIKGNSYGETMDEGVPASKAKVNYSDIRRWIDQKPVKLIDIKNKNKVANLIVQRIQREGIKGTGFLQEVIDKQFRNVLGITPDLIKDISANLEDILVTLGWEKQGDKFIREM
jgi:hypothetical protein|tara:strand:+ start:283 stop:861 length:579 start_codon:yes stop_codon:yes gene_type:complete